MVPPVTPCTDLQFCTPQNCAPICSSARRRIAWRMRSRTWSRVGAARGAMGRGMERAFTSSTRCARMLFWPASHALVQAKFEDMSNDVMLLRVTDNDDGQVGDVMVKSNGQVRAFNGAKWSSLSDTHAILPWYALFLLIASAPVPNVGVHTRAGPCNCCGAPSLVCSLHLESTLVWTASDQGIRGFEIVRLNHCFWCCVDCWIARFCGRPGIGTTIASSCSRHGSSCTSTARWRRWRASTRPTRSGTLRPGQRNHDTRSGTLSLWSHKRN